MGIDGPLQRNPSFPQCKRKLRRCGDIEAQFFQFFRPGKNLSGRSVHYDLSVGKNDKALCNSGHIIHVMADDHDGCSGSFPVTGYIIEDHPASFGVKAGGGLIEDQDVRMKPYFYPGLEKQELFIKGYIAKLSSHSRGSAVDLTLLDMRTGREVDMGSPFDLFSEISHPDYRGITDGHYENRMLLLCAVR